MNRTTLKIRLRERGWLPKRSVSDVAVNRALKQFQRWHGLRADGVLGPVSTRVLDEVRFCGLPDKMETRRGLSRWHPDLATRLTWTVSGPLTKFSRNVQDFIDANKQAWDVWMRHCRIRLEYTSNARTANIIHNAGRIDGPSNVLAWSELPNTNSRQLKQLYDHDEPFAMAQDPPTGKLDLLRVILHEDGHMLGLPHFSGRTGNLLDPTYNPRVRFPQAGDIREVDRRYPGGPITDPTPPSPPPAGVALQVKLLHIVDASGQDWYASGEMRQGDNFIVERDESIAGDQRNFRLPGELN